MLDADHHGLDEVKERIVEYLAVRARRAERGLQVIGGRGSGAVILLAGPPGVGKTSLGESVARALGRKFVRVALGGVRDEAEIRGHRRTYVGALPGRIVRAIKEAGSMNPVVLLDEVDKVGADYRGDPAAALLEVLDPAQNHTFRDHYLELDLDLSDVLFIATANVVDQIPSALLDRMELVTLDGYTEDDKVAIARDFLLPRQLERAAVTAEEVTVTDGALRELAGNYTREAGVRQMERLVAKALRKAATRLATEAGPIVVDEDNLKDLIGRPRFTPESHERTSVPGVATGLAVTGLGGDVLFIEASASDGEPRLTLTGQLGDVMKESAQIALSFVRSHAEQLGVDPTVLDRSIHVHVPAGAVPKDGPSAGVTMVTALVSLATGRPVRGEVGMTGEVTLNGRVLPIGGAKQKLLAAQRAGLTEVFLPQRNEADLDDVPADVLDAVTVHLVGDVLDVVAGALEPAVADSGRRLTSLYRPGGWAYPGSLGSGRGLAQPPRPVGAKHDDSAGLRPRPRPRLHAGRGGVPAPGPTGHPRRGRGAGGRLLRLAQARSRPAVLLGHRPAGRPAAPAVARRRPHPRRQRPAAARAARVRGAAAAPARGRRAGLGPVGVGAPRSVAAEQRRRGGPGVPHGVRLVARRQGDDRAFVEQVQLGAEPVAVVVRRLVGEGGEQLAHPGLLGPDQRQGGVVGAADLGEGVDEGAAALLPVEPAGEGVEDGQDPLGSRLRVLREVGQRPVLPEGGAATEVEHHQAVLGPEPVVERLLRGAGVLGDQLDADAADAALVEEPAGACRSAARRWGSSRGRRCSVRVVRSSRLLAVHCEYTHRYGYLSA